MIVVDSSIWIDWFANRQTIETLSLERFVIEERGVGVGDLVLTEVLQGARHDRHFRHIAATLSLFDQIPIVDPHVAVTAAHHYRILRAKGITIRKTIDALIATRCILDQLPLLYSDRDFDPFVEHLGLIPAIDAASGAP